MIGRLRCMFLDTYINYSTLSFNHKISTTETMGTVLTQRYMVYSSLPLHKRFVIVDQNVLRQKYTTALWCTCNKHTICALEFCYEA